MAPANPFSPGFGQIPNSLVGRDELLEDLERGHAVGPSDERYTTVLLGVRGSGKTVALTEIEDRSSAKGWVVLSVDASTKGLLERISRAVQQVARDYESLDLGDLWGRSARSRDRSLKVGPYRQAWSEQEEFDPSRDMGMREQLTLLARRAQQSGAAVLLTVDELHAADRDEARRLSNDIQHITKRSGLPLAFVGAGLLSMRYTVMEDRKITFFQRCSRHEMPPLSLADAIKGIRIPILDAGGRITDGALRMAAGSVGNLPYKLQVLGHAAWTVAGAPEREIDEDAVRHATEIAERTVDQNVSEPAFHDLSDTEQDFLAALAALGGNGTTAAIAREAGMNVKAARRVARRLDLSGYANRDSRGALALADLVPARVIAREAYMDEALPRTDGPPPAQTATSATGSEPRPTGTGRCRKWMPRARAYCILGADHAGRCRSR